MFLFIISEFHTIHPMTSASPSSQIQPSLKKKKKIQYQVQFGLSIYSIEHGLTSRGQPFKENWFLCVGPPWPYPQKPSTVKSYTSASLLQF